LKLTDSSVPVPTLIIVSGLPATGKSTLARRLATHFALPLMTKDMMKETLYDVLGYSDLSHSRRLGHACMVLLYQFAEAVLQTQHSCVIESTFDPEFSTPDLLSLQQRCRFVPLEIRCLAEPSVLVERWKRRRASGERHPGHLERLVEEEVCYSSKEEQAVPLALGGHVIQFDTTTFETIDYERLFFQLRNQLS
jgi:predicted kinase